MVTGPIVSSLLTSAENRVSTDFLALLRVRRKRLFAPRFYGDA